MMTKRKKIFIFVGIIAGVVIAAGILFYIFLLQPDSDTNDAGQNQQQAEQTRQDQNNNKPQEAETSSVPGVSQDQTQQAQPITSKERSRQVAVTFVERFGSYSSQNENQHIEAVLPMVTDEMEEWVQSNAAQQKQNYEGSTTVVIVSDVTSYSENDSATVKIQVQQTIEDKKGSRQVQKNGRVELTRQENQWKVDGLYWDN